MEIKKIGYDIKELIVHLVFDDNIHDGKLLLIERCMAEGNKVITPEILEFELTDEVSCIINLKEVLHEVCKAEVWDFYVYLKEENKYIRCNMNKNKDFKADYVEVEEAFKEIKPYVTGDKNLSLFCKKKISSLTCLEFISSDEGDVILILNKEFDEENTDIVFKRRVSQHMETYTKEIVLNYIDGIFSLKELNEKEIIDDSFYDIYLRLNSREEYGYDIPISYDYGNSEIYNGTFISNSRNRLGFHVNLEHKLYVSQIEMGDEMIAIHLEEENKIQDTIIGVELINKERPYTIIKGKEIKFAVINDGGTLLINKKYLYEITSKKSSKFIISIKQKNQNGVYSTLLRLNKKNVIEESVDGTKVIKGENIEKDVMLLTIKEEENPVKIAILGSCLTRSAFSTSKYFNPGYKEKYSVVYTHFQSSLISVMNTIPLEFNYDYFKESNDFMKGCLKVEFEKTFFDKLKESNCDYLILDFMADSMRGIIEFPNGSIITGNIEYEKNNVLLNLPRNVKITHSREIEKFLPLWEASAKEFAEKIVKYVPEEKIIINYSKLAEKYIDENNNINPFKGQIDYVRVSNALMDYTSNYMAMLLPKCKVVDPGQFNYIAKKNHPLGLSIAHFTSEYYRTLMCLIDSVIMNNK